MAAKLSWRRTKLYRLGPGMLAWVALPMSTTPMAISSRTLISRGLSIFRKYFFNEKCQRMVSPYFLLPCRRTRGSVNTYSRMLLTMGAAEMVP